MKPGIFTTAALALGISFSTIAPAPAQPSNSGNYVPGYWQPFVAVNPRQAIRLMLVNQAGVPLVYSPTDGAFGRGGRVAPGATAVVDIGISNRTGDIANILINPPTEQTTLHYDFAAKGNIVMVRIRPAAGQRIDKAVYIDERGRVYAF